jgi:YD repeat-containing protein
LKQVKRYPTDSSWLTWNYTYECSSPALVKIGVFPPGATEKQEIHYSYGVECQFIQTDGIPRRTRLISAYNSAVRSEENQHGGTMTYSYDAAGRVSKITFTSSTKNLNDIDMTWRPSGENKVVITRGANTIVKYWDGMGRETGHTETGGAITLYYRKVLDAEGRLKEESAGSTNGADRYTYALDNAGRVTSITDPMQNTTAISYAGIRKTVTDPLQRTTLYDHEDLPGLPTKVTDAQGRQAVHTYDAIGRLTGVNFNGARTHAYTYDWLDKVLTESHPETGTISYAYSAGTGKIESKTWGQAVQTYLYDEDTGRLTAVESRKNGDLDEEIKYSYDEKGRIYSVSSPLNGWSRAILQYSSWGSVESERLTTAGLGTKTIAYDYDDNNNQNKITYPDGRIALTGHNALNMPQTVTFNGKSIIDAATYGPNKMPTGISVAGNGTSFAASYTSSGLLSSASLAKGASTLYDAEYAYDGAGNITSIASTAPAPALSASFGYDALNRLTSATYSIGRVNNYAYEYDPYGNLTKVEENGGGAVFDKTYDNQNRLVGYSYDERGNLLAAGGKSYQWDSLNRLREIRNGAAEIVGQYLYDDRGLRLKAAPPLPEIDVYQDAIPDPIPIPDGGLSTFKIVSQEDRTFIVRNSGTAALTLGQVQISGQHANQFQVLQQPASSVAPQDSTTFIIRFQPSNQNPKEAWLELPSDDLDEICYIIYLFGNYEAEIDIWECPDGGTFDFGTVKVGNYTSASFEIRNLGADTLILDGNPIVSIEGPDGLSFSVEYQPEGSIPRAQSTWFMIRFQPTSEGPKTAFISIANNDLDENPYDITLVGVGDDPGPLKIIEDETELKLMSPQGEEGLRAGTPQPIIWSGGREAPYVRVEYSTDNGSTYRTIAARAPNDGRLDWLVPPELSSSCLIRVSDAEGAPVQAPEAVLYEFSFKVSRPRELYAPVAGFAVSLEVPDFRLQSGTSLRLEVIPDQTREQVYVAANGFWAAPRGWDVFLERWHRVKVRFETESRTASVWMDNELVHGSVGLESGPLASAYGTFTVSSEAGAGSSLRIEDVEVRIAAGGPDPSGRGARLFLEDFESCGGSEEHLGRRGWVALQRSADKGESGAYSPLNRLMSEFWGPRSGQAERGDFAVDEGDSVSGLRSLRMEKAENGPTVMTKIFSLPLRAPFAVSERPFAIVDREAGPVRRPDRGALRRRGEIVRGPEEAASPLNPGIKVAGPSGTEGGETRLLSVGPTGTYYVYGFDGRLLAEYNGLGICVRDYIYMGGKLIAEYRPQENAYLYYATDQIGSTRIVTDDTGAVVYAAAHDPWGGIQQTWTSAYDPALKFSGKERDTESGLDYFGARYYDHSLYRHS